MHSRRSHASPDIARGCRAATGDAEALRRILGQSEAIGSEAESSTLRLRLLQCGVAVDALAVDVGEPPYNAVHTEAEASIATLVTSFEMAGRNVGEGDDYVELLVLQQTAGEYLLQRLAHDPAPPLVVNWTL